MADLSSVETATDMLLSFVTLAHSLDVIGDRPATRE
jgi:hypothetical protein